MSTNRPIRVGIIRCDSHGAYFSPLMDDHDPLRLREPTPMDKPCRYSWQRGGTHFYFYMLYKDPRKMTAERVPGFEVVKLWDADRAAAQMLAHVHYDKPTVCDRFEQVSDDVDLVFISDCNRDGGDHLELATPGLKKGVATFVDKPFAKTVTDAKAILALADANNAPVMSMSILRAVPALTSFAQRLPETGGVNFGCVQGAYEGMDGLIHLINIGQHVFGDGVQRVRCLETPTHTAFHLDFGTRNDRPAHGVMLNAQIGPTFHGEMYCSAFGPRRAIHSHGVGDFEFPAGAAVILRLIREMVQTGRCPIDRTQLLESVAVAEAATRALQTDQTMDVTTLLSSTA